MWPFTKKKQKVPQRTLEFKTTQEETLLLCKLKDAWDAARAIWGHPPAIVRLRRDPIAMPQGPEECAFRYFAEFTRLCRQRIAEDQKTSKLEWPATFSYDHTRRGTVFVISVTGES